MTGLKLAALFIIHKNIKQAERLLRFFHRETAECFVHIDRKYSCNFENVRRHLESQENVHVLDERLSGTLADWSLVKITMLLVQSASRYGQKNSIHFAYYGLFSGQDYPIKPWRQFQEALEQSYPLNFLDIWKHGEIHVGNKFAKYRFWKVQNFLYSNVRNCFFRKALKVPVYLLEKAVTVIWKTPEIRLKEMGIGLYEGSAWWILSDGIIGFILGEWEKRANYLKVISNTSTPEESFFQILAMKSPYRDFIRKGDYKHIYCNFTPFGKPAMGHPYDITIEDLERGGVMQTPFFFARKFDFARYPETLSWIDNALMSK